MTLRGSARDETTSGPRELALWKHRSPEATAGPDVRRTDRKRHDGRDARAHRKFHRERTPPATYSPDCNRQCRLLGEWVRRPGDRFDLARGGRMSCRRHTHRLVGEAP